LIRWRLLCIRTSTLSNSDTWPSTTTRMQLLQKLPFRRVTTKITCREWRREDAQNQGQEISRHHSWSDRSPCYATGVRSTVGAGS
jgi:hypothetical protein